MNLLKRELQSFWRDESGLGTVEIILIMVVLIGLVVIFKKQLNDLVKKIFNKINSDSGSIISLLPQRPERRTVI